MGRSGQRSGKEGAKEGKYSRWKRRLRKTDQQGKMDRGQLSKRKKMSMSSLEHLTEKKERQASEALKMRAKWTWGFRYLGFWI
jgi:hypothetical protein